MPGSDEEAFAKKALFKRHPIMPEWPKGKSKFNYTRRSSPT